MDGVWMVVRTALALAVVLAAAAFGSRALARMQRPKGAGRLDLLGVVPLGGRRSVAVVRLGQRALVVGVGERDVTCLDVITDPLEVAAVAGEEWLTVAEAQAEAGARDGRGEPALAGLIGWLRSRRRTDETEERTAVARSVAHDASARSRRRGRPRITPELARVLWAQPLSAMHTGRAQGGTRGS